MAGWHKTKGLDGSCHYRYCPFTLTLWLSIRRQAILTREAKLQAPRFATQFDKEKFRAALRQISEVVNIDMNDAIFKSQPLMRIGTACSRDLDSLVTDFENIGTDWLQVQKKLFEEQNTLFSQNREYERDLRSTLPSDVNLQWRSFQISINNLLAGIKLVSSIQRTQPDDQELIQEAINNLAQPVEEYRQSITKIRELIKSFNQRHDDMVRSI